MTARSGAAAARSSMSDGVLDSSGGDASTSSSGFNASFVDHSPNMEDKFESGNEYNVCLNYGFILFGMNIFEGFCLFEPQSPGHRHYGAFAACPRLCW